MGTALAMYLSFLLLCRWIPPHWRRRCVGYGLFSDITVHVILQGLFGGDAAGRAGLLLAGVLINLTMHTYRSKCGYEKLTLDGWQRYNKDGTVVPPQAPE